jgi:hypothetical protein
VCETSGGCSAVSRFGVAVVFGMSRIVPRSTDSAHRAKRSGSARRELPEQDCRARDLKPNQGTGHAPKLSVSYCHDGVRRPGAGHAVSELT